ncbi:hypothetical protein GA0115246_115597 [Streptomyces sp. SolWspMP-sol7th]|nr:hypothetical protein GA0115246_115597 [Streptomyces sp. SolWspMP-sol7th]
MTEPAHHGPYTACTAARSACPVQVVSSGPTGRSSYLVTGYAEARQALGDARLSKDTAAFFAGKGSSRALHPALVHHMLASDPPEHTRLRKLVTGAFDHRGRHHAPPCHRPYHGRAARQLDPG